MSRLPQDDLDHIIRAMQPLWENLRGQRIFITGGTGFFGSWMTDSFIRANKQFGLNAHAVLLTRSIDQVVVAKPHLFENPFITLHEGDLLDFEFPRGNFSHVIHAAASVDSSFETIVEGTRHVLDMAVTCHATQFLLVSSGAVYGSQPSHVSHVNEDQPFQAMLDSVKSIYALGKRQAEELVCLYGDRYGITSKIARCFSFVGPYLALDKHYAVGNFIRDALNGRSIRLNGDGRTKRSYLYMSDLAIWLWTILFKGLPGRSYNVGSADAICMTDLANLIASLADEPVAVTHAATTGLINPDQYVPDTSRAKNELGLTQTIGLTEAVRLTMRWNKMMEQYHENAS